MASILIVTFILGVAANAQYFGQNKPSYKELDFERYVTPHFDIYHYLNDEKLIKDLGELSEKWYFYHQQVLIDTFHTRNPIIFYSNHADFQQTTAVSHRIDVGTGGVTEGMKRRVIMPITYSQHQTDHVLGHELVHAFQYHILETGTETSLMSVNNIPLWMIEGMAEYLSIGSYNSTTNLWMRDALIHDYFPTLKEMTYNYSYSPYRYGHSFWAFIAYQYGEQYIPRLFKTTALDGFEQAISEVLMISPDSLSILWQNTLRKHLINSSIDSTFTIVGERLLSPLNSGRYNLNPALSPNGKYVVFLAERDLYDIDLFLADTDTKEVISRLYTATSHDEIDAINYLETSGTWSPDSRYFAFIAFAKGHSACLIYDVKKKNIINEIQLDDVDEINWPSWSPNGKDIAFAGLKNGLSDIYIYNLNSKILTNITNNQYSSMQPSWLLNGEQILFVTDQPSPKKTPQSRGYYNIAYINKDGSNLTILPTFEGAKNLNPIDAGNSEDILFLSNYDGRRNIYELNLSSGEINRITNYPTGIIGMTEYSPALTMAKGQLCYTMMWDGSFSIVKTDANYFQKQKQPVNERQINMASLRLVPYSPIPSQIETNLYFNRQPYALETDSFHNAKIDPRFKLDYLGNLQGGIMASRFGAGMVGSVEALFSDILSQHMLYSAVSINGEIYDFGGQVAYINQRKRVKVGLSLSHIPYRYGNYRYETVTNDDGSTETKLNYIFRRTFEDKLSLFTFIPISKTKRFELGASYAYYSYRTEKLNDINLYTQMYSGEKEVIPSPSGFGAGILDGAFVIDNAKMGLASPVEGKRLRIHLEHYLHKMNMQTLLIDYRKYFFLKPYSMAFRIYHYGRYGEDSDSDRMTELYLGYPWFVRGYDSGGYYTTQSDDGNTNQNTLVGSRLIVSNLEWRIPFTGPKEIAWINSNFLFSEMALFVDGGICWDKNSHPDFSLSSSIIEKRVPIFSTGLAYRINLFGALVIEPYYAFPYVQDQMRKGNFGLNIFAGW